MYSDPSSSSQLIARKGLGKARHLDVDLLWMQKIQGLATKAIAGQDSAADLGTRSLTRDKTGKYMRCLGYVGGLLGSAEDQTKVQRTKADKRSKFHATQIERIVRFVIMAVLVGLGEALSDGLNDETGGVAKERARATPGAGDEAYKEVASDGEAKGRRRKESQCPSRSLSQKKKHEKPKQKPEKVTAKEEEEMARAAAMGKRSYFCGLTGAVAQDCQAMFHQAKANGVTTPPAWMAKVIYCSAVAAT